MIITEEQLRNNCTIIKKIKKERFYIREEDGYFTIYEKNGNIEGLVLEVSFSDLWITPDELWGIVKKRTRGHNVFIEEKEFEKIVRRQQEFIKDNNIETSKKIINIKEKLQENQSKVSIAKER